MRALRQGAGAGAVAEAEVQGETGANHWNDLFQDQGQGQNLDLLHLLNHPDQDQGPGPGQNLPTRHGLEVPDCYKLQ